MHVVDDSFSLIFFVRLLLLCDPYSSLCATHPLCAASPLCPHSAPWWDNSKQMVVAMERQSLSLKTQAANTLPALERIEASRRSFLDMNRSTCSWQWRMAQRRATKYCPYQRSAQEEGRVRSHQRIRIAPFHQGMPRFQLLQGIHLVHHSGHPGRSFPLPSTVSTSTTADLSTQVKVPSSSKGTTS